MRIRYFFLLVLASIIAQPVVSLAAVGDTTYATNPRHIQCGQSITGTLVAGSTIHQRVYEYGTGQMLFNLSDAQEVFRVDLPADGYLIINQPFATGRGLCLGKDSSNRSIFAYGLVVYPHLTAGTYYLTMAGWAGDYSFEISCNVPPTSVFGNAKLWAEPGTNNGVIRGSFAGAVDHLQKYIRTYWGITWPVERRGPERVYKIELPEDRYLEVANGDVSMFQSWYLIDSTGNPVDSVHHIPFGNVAAGTYYLSVEYDSASPVDSFAIPIRSLHVPPTCVPHLDHTAPFDQIYPWIGGLTGSINGSRVINPSRLYTSGQSAYTDRYTEDYAEMYLNTYNSFRLTTPPGYMRLYVDFNEDGDFNEGDELVVNVNTKPRIPTVIPVNHDWNFNATTSEKFLLPDTVARYRAALGKLLRYRVLVTDTNDQGACGQYNFGIATDGAVRLLPAPTGSSHFNTIHTLNDAKIARYKAVLQGPAGSFYGAGETVGRELATMTEYRHGMSQIDVSDGTHEPAYYSRWSYHHSILGTNNVVARYKANGRLAWYRIMDGYANDGSRLGNGVVDMPGAAMSPDSGITVLCHLEGGEVFPDGVDAATIGNPYSFEGYDRTLVVCYSPAGRVSMAQNFGSPKAPYNIRSCGYGTDGSLYMLGHTSYQQDVWWSSGDPHILGPLNDTLWLKPRGKADAILVKLLPNKHLGWMVNVAGAHQENGLNVSTSADGRLYILGTFDTTATVTSTASTDSIILRGYGPHSGYLVALTDSGQPLWARTWTISASNWDNDPYHPKIAVPIQLTTDAQGQNIVVAGGFRDQLGLDSVTLRSAGGMDGYGMGVDRDGHLRWAKSFGTSSDEEVSALTAEPDGMLRVGINYTTSINHVFGDGVLEAGSWSNVAIFRVDPASGLLVHGPGFVRFSGFDSLSVHGLHALPNGKMLVAGYSGAASYLPGWGMLCHEGFIGMTEVVTDTVPYVVPTAVRSMDVRQMKLHLYPNPSTGRVFIRTHASQDMPVVVLDAHGREILRSIAGAEALSVGYELTIHLQPGLYLVRFGTTMGRVIVH